MANTIFKGDQVILRCSNSVMEILHENLRKVVREKNINNDIILDTLEKLDQEIQGRGFAQVDINEQFAHAEESLNLFTVLVGLAIDQAVKVGLSPLIEERLRNFQKNLIATET